MRADWVDGTGITDTVTATDPSHYFGLLSQVLVTKTASASMVYAGASVGYTYTVANLGNGPVASVTATDDHCAPLVYATGDANVNDLLDVAESWTFTCTTTLNTTTTNTATIGGTDLLGEPVSDQDTATVATIAPAIGLTKVAAPVIVAPGQAVTYTFTVTNAGDDPLSAITLSDDQCAPLLFEGGDLNADTLLDLSETVGLHLLGSSFGRSYQRSHSFGCGQPRRLGERPGQRRRQRDQPGHWPVQER